MRDSLLKRILLPAALLAAPAISAQTGMTVITGANLKMAGARIATGTVTFTAVNMAGLAISFVDGAGGQDGPVAFSCLISNGVVAGLIQPDRTVSGACAVPDASLTTPANILYTVQVTDTSTGRTTSGRSYMLTNIAGISGANWPLDHYAPPAQTSAAQVLQAAHGPNLPTSCIAPSIFTLDPTAAFYQCVGGSLVLVTGGPGTVTFGTTAGTSAVGNDTRIVNAEQLGNKGVPLGYAGLDTSGHLPAAYSAPIAVGDTARTAGQLPETVVGIQGKPVSPTAPANGQALVWSTAAGAYIPATPAPPVTYGTAAGTAAQGNDTRIVGAEQASNKGAAGGYAPLDGSGFIPAANTPPVSSGDVTRAGGQLAQTVVALQGKPVASTAPATGQALAWNGTAWAPTASVTTPATNTQPGYMTAQDHTALAGLSPVGRESTGTSLDGLHNLFSNTTICSPTGANRGCTGFVPSGYRYNALPGWGSFGWLGTGFTGPGQNIWSTAGALSATTAMIPSQSRTTPRRTVWKSRLSIPLETMERTTEG